MAQVQSITQTIRRIMETAIDQQDIIVCVHQGILPSNKYIKIIDL